MSRSRIVLAIFVLSGAAGLIYEIVWSRQLVLVFGNTTQAVSAILTGFFGGMAIGGAVGGRIADRVRSPLRLYGLLEVVLVVVVLATPLTFQLIHEVYRGAYGALSEAPAALALVRFGLALVALAPATVLMGATLPALTRHLTRRGHLSAAFGRLYAANTIGAIVGTLVAGLVLIELLGLTGALAVGAACSGVAGIVALVLDRGAEPWTGEPTPAPADALAATAAAVRSRVGLALAVAFVSGLTSLGYQVLWTRLLASGTGNSTYVFTMILAVFLAGIATGAVLFNVLRPRIGDPVRLLAVAQVVVAGLVVFGVVWLAGRNVRLDPSQPLTTIRALVTSVGVVVFPATVVMGLAFPASSALLSGERGRIATSTGTLVAVNTVGAICGSFLVPFLLVPLTGSPAAVAVLALLNTAVALGLVLLLRRESPRLSLGLGGVTGALALGIVLVLAGRTLLVDPSVARIERQGGTIFDSTEDEIASVQAGQRGPAPELWVTGTSMTALTVDAKLMPLLPLMARPDSSDALIVAFGMGTSFRSSLIAGLEAEAVELVPSVPQMFGWYYDDAEAVLADPRGKVLIADGRNHLELTDRQYDIIVTDPPPPLESSGASVISSLEYYEAGHAALQPGGIMMQWLPWGSTVPEYFAHLRSFARVFPEVAVFFGPAGYGSYMLGSDEPIDINAEAMRAVLERPGVLDDLALAFDTPVDSVDGWIDVIERARWLSGSELDAAIGDGPLVTDDRPLPEYFMLRRLLLERAASASPTYLRSLSSQ